MKHLACPKAHPPSRGIRHWASLATWVYLISVGPGQTMRLKFFMHVRDYLCSI